MKLLFHEIKADGYPDEDWFAYIDTALKEYNLSTELFLRDNKKYVPNIGKSEKNQQNLNELINSSPPKIESYLAPVVSFSAPSDISDTAKEKVNLYWIEKIKSWVAITEYEIREHDHTSPWSECHRGPYAVEGILEEKLLEAYSINKESVNGKIVSKIPPSELEKLTIK